MNAKANWPIIFKKFSSNQPLDFIDVNTNFELINEFIQGTGIGYIKSVDEPLFNVDVNGKLTIPIWKTLTDEDQVTYNFQIQNENSLILFSDNTVTVSQDIAKVVPVSSLTGGFQILNNPIHIKDAVNKEYVDNHTSTGNWKAPIVDEIDGTDFLIKDVNSKKQLTLNGSLIKNTSIKREGEVDKINFSEGGDLDIILQKGGGQPTLVGYEWVEEAISTNWEIKNNNIYRKTPYDKEVTFIYIEYTNLNVIPQINAKGTIPMFPNRENSSTPSYQAGHANTIGSGGTLAFNVPMSRLDVLDAYGLPVEKPELQYLIRAGYYKPSGTPISDFSATEPIIIKDKVISFETASYTAAGKAIQYDLNEKINYIKFRDATGETTKTILNVVPISAGSNGAQILNDPINNLDVVNKKYVDGSTGNWKAPIVDEINETDFLIKDVNSKDQFTLNGSLIKNTSIKRDGNVDKIEFSEGGDLDITLQKIGGQPTPVGYEWVNVIDKWQPTETHDSLTTIDEKDNLTSKCISVFLEGYGSVGVDDIALGGTAPYIDGQYTISSSTWYEPTTDTFYGGRFQIQSNDKIVIYDNNNSVFQISDYSVIKTFQILVRSGTPIPTLKNDIVVDRDATSTTEKGTIDNTGQMKISLAIEKSIESVDIERTGSVGNETGSFDKSTGKLLLKLAPLPTVEKDTTYITKWVDDTSKWKIENGNLKRNEPLTNDTDLLLDIQCVTGTIISNRETQGFLAVGNDKPFSYLNGAADTNWKVTLDDLSTIDFESNALKNDNFQVWRLTLVGTAPTPLEIDSKYFKGDGTTSQPLSISDEFSNNAPVDINDPDA